MPTLRGSCHCGNISLALETEQEAAKIALRACSCSFCTRHRARTMADPAGRAGIEVRDQALLSRYRFGLRTAEFIICARCGAYAGALLREGARAWATLNANLFLDPALVRAAESVSYEGETAEARIARRKLRWTPTRFTVLHPAAGGGKS